MPYYSDAVSLRVVHLPTLSLLAALALAGCDDGRTRGPDDPKGPPTRFPSVVRFEPSAAMVKRGETVTLYYEVVDADTVEIRPDLLPSNRTLVGEVESPPLIDTTSFTLVARSSAGETSAVVTVSIGTTGEGPEILSFTATPTVTAPRGAVRLAWSTARATAVRLETREGQVVEAMAAPTGTLDVNPTDSTTWVLVAEGGGMTARAEVFVEVGKLPSIERFAASPPRIDAGAASSLEWTVVGADSLRIADAQGTPVHAGTEGTGSIEVRPGLTTEYVLTAVNAIGPVEGRVTVTVGNGGQAEITELSATPSTLPFPGDVELRWATRGADRTSMVANNLPVPGFPGTVSGQLTLSVPVTTRFELVAEGGGGTARQAIVVTVQAAADTDPPVLRHVPVVTTRVAGVAVPITAQVTDAGAGVDTVRLHYRLAGAGSYAVVALTDMGSGDWAGEIPAVAVAAPGVEYYLEALDRAQSPNRALDPANAPTTVHEFGVQGLDQTAPVIVHTPVPDGQVAATSVMIEATVTDPGSGVDTVVLFHRIEGAAQFQSAALVAVGGDRYRVALPGAQVQIPAVEYYLAATDGAAPANAGRLPANAPTGVFRFTVSPQDQTGPVLTHSPVPDGRTAGGSVSVAATATDPSGVASVSLFYRAQGGASYVVLAMVESMGTWRAAIPGNAVAAPGVQYYLEARDSLGNAASSPAAGATGPYAFTVTTVDQNPPSIVHTALTGVRPRGAAVRVTAEVADASGVASVTLNYRSTGASTWQAATMTGGPSYAADIPAAAVVPPGVEYYLQATDGASPANAGTQPAMAPVQFHAFSVGVAETEANDTAATADALLPLGTTEETGFGAITPSSDLDWWFVEVPTGGFYNLELETTSGGPTSCPSPIDTVLRLYDGDGTTVRATDSTGGVGACSLIRPQDDAGALALAPGRYYVRVEESGNNAVVGGYELRARLTPTRCGNALLEAPAGEQCDDGNTTPGDGCSATCRVEPDGVTAAPGRSFTGDLDPAGDRDWYALDLTAGQNVSAELSDGMGGCPGDTRLELLGPDGLTVLGSDDDDGPGSCSAIRPLVDTWAAGLAAGRYFLRVSAFSPSAVIRGYTLSIAISDNLCGNGRVETGEQCDDGNATSSDGCSSTCAWETVGTAMGAGAAFTDAISPIGNVDFYAVVLQAGDSIRAETFAPTSGQCDTGVDTVLRLLAADRTTQIATDDQDGIRSCSQLDPARDLEVRNLAAGTYYLSVAEFGNNAVIAAYALDVQILRAGCGNGWIDGADQCDDGNTTPSDGCSATCQLEGRAELEPNDSVATATSLLTGGATVATIRGAIDGTADLDHYAVTVPAGWHVFAEVSDGRGGCPGSQSLRLLAPDGTTTLVFDSTDGPGDCGRISPQTDAAARGLMAGVHTIQVGGAGGVATPYVLEVRLLAPGCGDGFLDMGESCDDGNQASGDGCSASCQLEGVGEVEPNETTATATPLIPTPMSTPAAVARGVVSSASDVDVYAVEVPAGWHLAAQIDDGRGGCPNGGNLRLRGPNGTTSRVSDTADGPQDCGRIAPALDTQARALSAGTYYLEVTAGAGRTAVYSLDARVTAPSTCGNLVLDAGEQCDEGNAAAGDGCSDTCQIERREVEPNNGAMSATALPAGPLQTIGGAITSGDSDFYSVTVAAGASLQVQVHSGGIDECGTSSMDSVVALTRTDGSAVAEDDDSGPLLCSTIDGAAASGLAAGTYLIEVRPYSTQTFDYVLTVRVF